MLGLIDSWLNRVTMYRLLLYGLIGLAGFAGVLSLAGVLPYELWQLLMTIAILVMVCYFGNRALALAFRASPNSESSFITAFILFFIMPPVSDLTQMLQVSAVALLAMVSKYLIAWKGQHIFNPAAIAAVVAGLFGLAHATWWVAAPSLLPLVLVLGLLVVRKNRRFQLLGSFGAAALVLLVMLGMARGRMPIEVLVEAVISLPLLFFGTIMLIEPSTLPPRRSEQLLFGTLVGALFASQMQFGVVLMTPEMALLVGNLFGAFMSPKRRWRMTLKERRQLSEHVYDFIFTPNAPVHFLPGQYMEWTLPHHHADGRGNRRTFSVASSPTEHEVHIGIKTYEPSSSYKKALLALEPGRAISVGQVAGDFVLPGDSAKKLLFVAGGIGVTPFRSMLKYLHDTNQPRDIVLLYFVATVNEISYTDVLRAAQQQGVRVVPVLTGAPPANWQGATGFLTRELLQKYAPDYLQRLFYLSGPQPMVQHYRDTLRRAGVKPSSIKTDYFTGY